MKKILIIIVTWNKKDYVVQLLESINQLTFDTSRLDILVIDNASTDGTVDTLKREFSSIQIIANQENLGGTGGFNTGIAWALAQEEEKYEYLWLLDNDVVVHNDTLSHLVRILENTDDAAICGSTMMQLDFPWRINEMGAFVDTGNGNLILHRHQEEIPKLKGVPVKKLIKSKINLSKKLDSCPKILDVEYVAAASLLIRTSVAREAGLWEDFFIHFDDVEWCMRIGKLGYRILASSQSLIWHLSAHAKIPTWILYYDNRNILYLLEKHSTTKAVKKKINWIKKKAIYYSLIGKNDLAQLHLQAIQDYRKQIKGKADISVSKNTTITDILSDTSIKKILVPWTINLHTTKTHEPLSKLAKSRPDLEISYLHVPGALPNSIPGALTREASQFRLFRWFNYVKQYHYYDAILQSDYHVIPAFSWLGRKTIFINDDGASVSSSASLKNLFSIIAYTFKT